MSIHNLTSFSISCPAVTRLFENGAGFQCSPQQPFLFKLVGTLKILNTGKPRLCLDARKYQIGMGSAALAAAGPYASKATRISPQGAKKYLTKGFFKNERGFQCISTSSTLFHCCLPCVYFYAGIRDTR